MDDLSWRAFLAWHLASQRLYVGVERIDDVYEEEGMYTGDRTQFIIDGDHSGGQFMGFGSVEELGSNAQSYWIESGVRSSTGSSELVVNAFSQWVAQGPWAEFGFTRYGETPSQTVTEFSVTAWNALSPSGAESSRQTVLQPNAIVGVQLVLRDEDGGTDMEVHWLVRPVCRSCEAPAFFADTFADGQLIPCDVGDCSGQRYQPTSVAGDSWGRIKASFR